MHASLQQKEGRANSNDKASHYPPKEVPVHQSQNTMYKQRQRSL
ncbi:uncharacterized protein J3R85_008761 [Psidium guajava]|nr:uncharacterized protein J3R85_008761 [Psidium guajava]